MDSYSCTNCRSQQPTTLHTDVYLDYFSQANVDRLLDRVQRMGYPRPSPRGDGLYRQMYRIYESYPGYQGVTAGRWDLGTVRRHVFFMNDQFMRLYGPDMGAKQMLYDAYDRDRSSPLRPIDNPVNTSTHRKCMSICLGDRLR